MQLSPIDRIFARIPVTAKLADGSPATIAGVDVTVLPTRTSPSATTTWTAATYAAGVATVLLAGPEASPTGALVIPTAGADIWIRVTDNPEVDAAKVGRVDIV